jgi:hypothetical protein
MLRRHPYNQNVTTPENITPVESFDEASTVEIPDQSTHSVSFSPSHFVYVTPPPSANIFMSPDSMFLRPPTPFEAGLMKGELPPHRRVSGFWLKIARICLHILLAPQINKLGQFVVENCAKNSRVFIFTMNWRKTVLGKVMYVICTLDLTSGICGGLERGSNDATLLFALASTNFSIQVQTISKLVLNKLNWALFFGALKGFISHLRVR